LVKISGWPTNRNEALVQLARPGGRLLEIGCGSGIVLATLASQYQELVGIELSSIRAEKAHERLALLSNCRVLNSSLEELPSIETEPFDCILWADVIEHVADVIATMHILAGLSQPGTQLVTTTPNVVFLPYRLRLLMGRGPNTALPLYPNEGFAQDPLQTVLHDAGHFHYFTFRQVEILYQIAGFWPEQRLGFGRRFGRLRNYWPTLLSGTVCISGSYIGKKAI
jgi:ubiquinone/menaquinone biosynthesis C-methylase UbiE